MTQDTTAATIMMIMMMVMMVRPANAHIFSGCIVYWMPSSWCSAPFIRLTRNTRFAAVKSLLFILYEDINRRGYFLLCQKENCSCVIA